MYKTRPMKQAFFLIGLCTTISCGIIVTNAQTLTKTADERMSLPTRTAGLKRHDGFFPYYWDEKKGDILFELSPAMLSSEFLYFTGLGSGIGSTDAFADRSSFGSSAVCRFRRVGMRVLVIQENTSFARFGRRSRTAALRGIQLSNFSVGFASSRGRAGWNAAGRRYFSAGAGRFRSAVAIATANSGGSRCVDT